MKKEIIGLAASDRQYRLEQDKLDILPQMCHECAVLFACHGECHKNHFLITSTGESGMNYLCEDWKAFFHRINFPMKIIVWLTCDRYLGSDAMRIIKLNENLLSNGHNDSCHRSNDRKFKFWQGHGKINRKR